MKLSGHVVAHALGTIEAASSDAQQVNGNLGVDLLLKADEVKSILRISTASLYRRVADGTLPRPLKLGSLSRWSQRELFEAVMHASDRR